MPGLLIEEGGVEEISALTAFHCATCGPKAEHPIVRSTALLHSASVSMDCAVPYSFNFRSRSEFVITETELRLMAAAARIGLSSRPKNGYSTPAAIGTPSEL